MKTAYYPGFPAPDGRRIARIEHYAARLEDLGAECWLYVGGGATLDVRIAPDTPPLRLAADAPLPVALTAARVAAQILGHLAACPTA